MSQLISAIISVVIALGVGFAVFVGANMLVDRAETRWKVFVAGVATLAGTLVGAVLQHNGWLPKIGTNDDGTGKLTLGDTDIGGIPTILVVAAIFGVVGYFVADRFEPEHIQKVRLKNRIRPIVFLGPAVLFTGVTLVVPSVITGILSLRAGKRGDEGWGIGDTWGDIFTSDEYFTVTGIGNIPFSRLFMIGIVGVVLAGALAWGSARRLETGVTGQRANMINRTVGWLVAIVSVALVVGFIEALIRGPIAKEGGGERNNPSAIYDFLTVVVSSPILFWVGFAALVAGGIYWWNLRRNNDPIGFDWGAPGSSLMMGLAIILVLLAVFSTLTGVIWNNLWWVVTVAGLSTFLGLLLAILSDRSKSEQLAKVLIFLPMAISMVGAAVIWGFVYEIQVTGTQTGLFNALLEWMGYKPRGFFINASLIPWNNFFIMIILVWIQTGFAMVVLSAAIKGVPEEIIEAARVDGASEVQTFWRVVIPQIITTIMVVTTTLIIVAMKIFDLVKATTNGANSTDVLANAMFNDLRDANFTRSSAFAVLIFLLTLPVMIYNVRRTQRELA